MSAKRRAPTRPTPRGRRTSPRPADSGERISVRMYNVGFGDCFLITFPAPDRPRKVLIDCGFHSAGPPPTPLRDVVDAVIADATEADGPRIDVVICTHRHKDHVFGFETGEPWKRVRVDEVWMPWTEHPTDPEARKIREAQAKKAASLMLALDGLTGLGAAERLSLREIVENNLTNAGAMETLHRGFSGPRSKQFLPALKDGSELRRLSSAALPGVTVHVLGPSRDKSVIREMNPPKEESFLRRAAALAGEEGAAAPAPFLLRWAVSPDGERFPGWFKKAAERGKGLSAARRKTDDKDFLAWWINSLGLRSRDLEAVNKAEDDNPLAAAVALDKAVNGTSLMLMFEVGGAFLLFPGDAQWGTWKRALEDPEWRELLGRTTFYKVGHHGSHNATPVQFVNDVLGRQFQAMVSTKHTKKFDDIPRGPLMDRLIARSQLGVVRSDAATVSAPFKRVSPLCIEASLAV